MTSNPDAISCSGSGEQLPPTLLNNFSAIEHHVLYEQHYLAMFHHALVENDQHARESLQQSLNKVVLGWIRLHPQRKIACLYEDEEYYASRVFEGFWQITAHYQVEIRTLAAMLQYLRASLNGVIIDTLRTSTALRRPCSASG